MFVYMCAILNIGYYYAHSHLEGFADFAFARIRKNEAQTCPNIFVSAAQKQGMDISKLCTLSSEIERLMEDHRQFLSTQSNPYKEQASELRKQLEELISSRVDATTAADQLKAYANHLAYLAMKDQCVELKDAAFTYKACMLGSVNQHDDKGDHGQVLLGEYYGQIEESDINSSGSKYYNSMKFHNGQHCHAFGARSAEIHIYCGTENKLLSAREPSTCAYFLEMESPAACTPRFAQQNGLDVPGS